MDIVGPLFQTLQDNKYLLTFQDGLPKFTIGVPLKQQDAMTLARAFIEEIILKFGIPQVLLAEEGSNFLSELLSNVCKLLRVKRIKTSAYRPQTNGALERMHSSCRIFKMLHSRQSNRLGSLDFICHFCIQYHTTL